jgi:beta-N-acetylhexosaminidase
MSPQQKVGQLLMVTFEGSYLGQDADITRLIQEYYIGGVLLSHENNNINGRAAAEERVLALTSGLQRLSYEAAQDQNIRYLPLLVGVGHNGNGLPYTDLDTATTPLPSYMALGATWNPDYAYQVGYIAGQELSGLGVNVLFGPSLDVVGQVSGPANLLQVQSFGGEPYWVGQMGAAYIQGAHEGSDYRLLVIPRHWPGLGSIDRELSQELPFVPRTAEELRRFDLVPFFMVTGGASNRAAQADGLQCANIRYQGENIRAETRPVCMDEAAFRAVLNQSGYGEWRERGLIVSDALGTRALRRWYNISPFPHRQVARDALLAGNDLLLLAQFGPEFDAAAFENIADTLRFFAESYQSDRIFAARVDQALERIIRYKLVLYGPDLSYEGVQVPAPLLDRPKLFTNNLFEIAGQSVTLMAPQAEQLPPPPQGNERLLIFSDTRPLQQCDFCPPQALLGPTALEDAIQGLYGDSASGQIRDEAVQSYTLGDLQAYLNSGGRDEALRAALAQADWVVFAILDDDLAFPSAGVMRQFLGQSEDLLDPQARMVVFAFGAPYYLSPTDISKLSAYYALYSHSPPFLEAAARALFQEIPPAGYLPISVQAVNYDIFEATSPDPGQTLGLVVSKADGQADADLNQVRVGDTLLIQTGPILDHNGHIVPDGTPVVFTLSFLTEGVQTQEDASTVGGIAEANFILKRAGQVEIRATSLQATAALTIVISVGEDAMAATLQTLPPPTFTSTATATDTPSLTASPSPTATATPSPSPSPTATFTLTDTASPSPTATATPSPSPSLTATLTLTDTASPSPTATLTLTDTASPSPTATATDTTSPSPTATATPSPTPPAPPARRPDEALGSKYVSTNDFLLSLASLILLVIPAFAGGWAASRSLDGTLRIVLGTVVAGLTGYVYYGAGAPGAGLLRQGLGDLAAVSITFLAGATGLLFTWWTIYQSYQVLERQEGLTR